MLLVLFAISHITALAVTSYAAETSQSNNTGKTNPNNQKSRFEDKTDGTVMDSDTGLMWVKDADLIKIRLPWQAAKDFIEDMNSGLKPNYGYADWRMPDIRELSSILDKSQFYPALPMDNPFINVRKDHYYWSSSIGFNIVGYVWVADMASGNIKYDYLSYCNFQYVWPVRSTELSISIDLKKQVVLKASADDLKLASMDLGCKDSIGAKTPDTPPNVTATAVSQSELVVTWTAPQNTADVSWYNIYEGEKLTKTVPGMVASFKGLSPDTKKCFAVTAVNNIGLESSISKQVCTSTWSSSASGTVWSEGINTYGQLGNGTTEDGYPLVLTGDLTDIVKVAAGVEHGIALKKDGTVWVWGRNNRGQLGDGTMIDRLTPVQVTKLTGIIDIAAGWYHTMALKSDGTVWAWGRNYYGQIGDGTLTDRITPIQVKSLKDVKNISAGWYHSIAIRANGTVAAWGWNLKGQLGNGDRISQRVPVQVIGLTDIVKVDGGMYHTLALKSDGSVWAWGWNEFGQLGNGNRSDATFPTQVKRLDEAIDIAGGMHYSVAVRTDGTVWAWGRNEYGQLGSDAASQSSVPMQVSGIVSILRLDAGAHHVAAINNEGNGFIWGWDFGSKKKKTSPRLFKGIGGIIDIASGTHFTMVLKK